MGTFFRRLPKVDYCAPENLEEVLSLISGKQKKEFIIYAGGTDLIPKIKKRLIEPPEMLIDLKGIPDLNYIDYDPGKGLKIGALTTVRSVATSPIVKKHFPIFSQAADSIASTQIQNRATVVGNICNAVPSADSAPALLALQASLLCVSLKGERIVPLEKFFIGPGQTILKEDEIVREIQIPEMVSRSRGIYFKLSPRKRMDLALVGVAVILDMKEGICEDLRIGLGAVAPTPLRAKKAEAILCKEKLTLGHIERTAEAAADESRPIDDHRASAYYRKAMVRILVKRGIQTLSQMSQTA